MAHPFLLYVLSRPHRIPASSWEQFYHDDHLDDLIKNKVAAKGSMYKVTANPMGRSPPDDHTHLVLFETEYDNPFQSPGFTSVNNTSPLFPPGASTPDVSDLECRHYKLLEVFDPKGSGRSGKYPCRTHVPCRRYSFVYLHITVDKAAPFVLQTEISVDDVYAFLKCVFHFPTTAAYNC